MTDRFTVLTVVLEKPLRDDDAEPLIQAISRLRGVLKVTGVVADSETYAAEERVRYTIMDDLRKIVAGWHGTKS